MDVLESFLDTSKRFGSSLAVATKYGGFTYVQLSSLAANIAGHLCGAAAERVFIHLTPCPAAYAAMIGSWMAGAHFCAQEVNSPLERRRRIVETYNPDVVIASAQTPNELNTNSRFLYIESLSDLPLQKIQEAHE